MATGGMASFNQPLSEEDLSDVVNQLHPVAYKYKVIGIQLKHLGLSDIKNIEAKYSDPLDRLLEVLSLRLQRVPALTWGSIYSALKSKSVDESLIAEGILKEYGHPSSEVPSYPEPVEESGEKTVNSEKSAGEGSLGFEREGRSERQEEDLNEEVSGRGKRKIFEKDTEAQQEDKHCFNGGIKEQKKVSEIEKLRSNVFERFYGRLCCEISNPVETAAQLQMKGLISKEVMMNVIKSPESQQVKTLSLVVELDEIMKSKPDCLFTFIEVLLENDALQKVGRELLTEASKQYPEETLERFPSQVPPSQNIASSSKFAGPVRMKIESIPNAVVSELSGNQSACAADSSSTQEVSKSIPQSYLSPVLARYKQYLQSCYNARVLALADKYLPTMESPYINLAIIRRGRYNHRQRDEFTMRTLHGGVDEILWNKTPIHIEDLLTPDDGSRLVKFILVEGPPGIGKSTFAWEVCRRWDEIESLKAYHTVVLLRVREKWVLNATSLSDLLRYPSHPDFSNSIAEELVQSQGEKLLFVLDGFDEVSHNIHENSVIKSILCRQLLPECTIILTTRPVAKATLESICQPRVDKHVEIIGFTDTERVRYITEVFSKEPELQVNFFKYMFLVPHIKSMMYIPLNCAIISQVYYESQSSHHLAIPRTRTQLYKALTHSLLVRHMKMKESNCEYLSMLPEGLDEELMNKFQKLAKFAFDTYHKGQSRKVTFFKDDIPEGLVHFGFMNESTEMYAGKGVEQTFSFLHLSLQEYLAAWHLADSYSIKFQVAYHRLAVEPYGSVIYEGDEKEQALISSLKQQRSSLVEPAIFLAGITGWRCQSGDGRNRWEIYLSHDTVERGKASVLLQSLYEAQNPTLCPHYFGDTEDVRDPSVLLLSPYNPTFLPHYYAAGKSAGRRIISIGSFNYLSPTTAIAIRTPYDCYALSYCLAHSSDKLGLSIGISRDDEVALVETFVKGLKDHCKSNTPKFTKLKIHQTTESSQNSNNCLFWLTQANCWTELKELEFGSQSSELSSDLVHNFFNRLVKVRYVFIHIPSWEWLPLLQSLSGRELKGFHINKIFDAPQYKSPDLPRSVPMFNTDTLTRRTPVTSHSQIYYGWNIAVLDIEFPSSIIKYSICYSINVGINSLLKSVQRSNQITRMDLSNISRETMDGVRSILLHCPSLVKLELKRTRLGYDGILYICSALRNNTTLKHLVIRDDLQLPSSRRKRYWGDIKFITFSSMKRVPLPDKTTCTDFLLELNKILKGNTTLEEMNIQSGLFLPLSAGGDGEYCRWTGLGPLQQFNVGAIGSGMSPNLRRSFSSSDLTQPQTTFFWDSWFAMRGPKIDVDFKMVFSKKKFFSMREEGKKLMNIPSFTAPDTEVLQSFSGLDPRLNECLEITHLPRHLERLGETYWGMLGEVYNMRIPPRQSPSAPSPIFQRIFRRISQGIRTRFSHFLPSL